MPDLESSLFAEAKASVTLFFLLVVAKFRSDLIDLFHDLDRVLDTAALGHA